MCIYSIYISYHFKYNTYQYCVPSTVLICTGDIKTKDKIVPDLKELQIIREYKSKKERQTSKTGRT